MLLAAMLALQSAPLPQIVFTPAGQGGTLLVKDFPEARGDDVTAEFRRKATAHCGSLSVRWGRYNGKTSSRMVSAGQSESWYTFYEQKFTCYDPANDPYKPVPGDWTPSEADKSDAIAFAERHLTAMDRRDVTAVMNGFEPILELSRAEAEATIADFVSRTQGQTRRFRPLVWLANPDDAGHPGAYVYAVFQGPRSCGYLMLYRVGTGRYQVSQLRVMGLLASQTWTERSEISLRQECAKL